MPMSRAVTVLFAAVTLVLTMMVASMAPAQQAIEHNGDPERGKIVFRSVGNCVNCHGWAADGISGVNLRAPTGSNLRETTLDTERLTEVIKCGLLGTAMPYHDRAAYRDDRCYGMVMSDFVSGGEPMRGKTFRDNDIANVVAYLQTHVIGLGEPTYAECAEFFDNPAARACRSLR